MPPETSLKKPFKDAGTASGPTDSLLLKRTQRSDNLRPFILSIAAIYPELQAQLEHYVNGTRTENHLLVQNLDAALLRLGCFAPHDMRNMSVNPDIDDITNLVQATSDCVYMLNERRTLLRRNSEQNGTANDQAAYAAFHRIYDGFSAGMDGLERHLDRHAILVFQTRPRKPTAQNVPPKATIRSISPIGPDYMCALA